MLVIILLWIFCFSYAQERVIIQNRGDYYHVETYNIPEYKPSKQKLQKKYHRKKRKRKEKYYLSKEKGKVFHRPHCKFAKKIKKKVRFKTRSKAVKSGLRPCRVCKP